MALFKAAGYLDGEGDDLEFITLVRNTDEQLLPFKHLLCVINNTHTEDYKQD